MKTWEQKGFDKTSKHCVIELLQCWRPLLKEKPPKTGCFFRLSVTRFPGLCWFLQHLWAVIGGDQLSNSVSKCLDTSEVNDPAWAAEARFDLEHVLKFVQQISPSRCRVVGGLSVSVNPQAAFWVLQELNSGQETLEDTGPNNQDIKPTINNDIKDLNLPLFIPKCPVDSVRSGWSRLQCGHPNNVHGQEHSFESRAHENMKTHPHHWWRSLFMLSDHYCLIGQQHNQPFLYLDPQKCVVFTEDKPLGVGFGVNKQTLGRREMAGRMRRRRLNYFLTLPIGSETSLNLKGSFWKISILKGHEV